MGVKAFEELALKSPNDKKLYRLCTLNNGLQALLIHDPEINAAKQNPEETNTELQHAVEPSDEDVESLMEDDDEDDEGSEEVHQFNPQRHRRCQQSGSWHI